MPVKMALAAMVALSLFAQDATAPRNLTDAQKAKIWRDAFRKEAAARALRDAEMALDEDVYTSCGPGAIAKMAGDDIQCVQGGQK